MLRAVSLLVSLVATGVLMVVPFLVSRQMTPVVHAILAVLVLGVSAGFIHGLGYIPRRKSLRILVSPPCAWPLIAVSLLLLMVR